MTTYNTGNPIGSTDSRDRLDNTENMDYLENSTTELTRLDRLGNVRKTRHGMETEHDAQIAAHESEHDAQISAHENEHDAQMQSFENDFDGRLAGMAFTRVGSFTTGATLTDMRQVLIWEVSQGGDGHEYGWAGTFPKVVAAGSTPATSGGIGAGAWVDRTNDSLRSDLLSTSGASHLYYGTNNLAYYLERFINNFASIYHVDNYGAVGDAAITGAGTSGNVISGTDDTAAIQAALDAIESAGGGVLMFNSSKSYRLTYSLQYGSNIIIDFNHAAIIWDPLETPTDGLNADKMREASFLIGKYFQSSSSSEYSTNVIIRNGKIYTKYHYGNGIGLAKTKRSVVEDIESAYCDLHIVDCTGSKDVVIQRIVDGGANVLAHIQVDSFASQSSVSAISAAGTWMPCAYETAQTSEWAYSDNVTIRCCKLYNSGHAGIHLHNKNSRRIKIEFNYLALNAYGIYSDSGGLILNSLIQSNEIRENTNQQLGLFADHRQLFIDKNIIEREVRTNEYCLIDMTGSASATSGNKKNIVITNNIFKGMSRAVLIPYYTCVTYKNNVHNNMGASLTLATAADVSTYGASLSNCSDVDVSDNKFTDCIVDACIAGLTNTAMHVKNNKAITSGSLFKLISCTDSSAQGNSERPLNSVLVGSYMGSCSRSKMNGNNSFFLPSAGVACFNLNACTTTTVGDNTAVTASSAGYGILITDGDVKTSNNHTRSVSIGIQAMGSAVVVSHEPFIPAWAIINGGTGTITYTTFTTSVK